MRRGKAAISLVVLLCVMAVLAYDSSYHFMAGSVEKKRAHGSPQRNWNLWYGPEYVRRDSPIRYEEDLSRIELLVVPGSALWSDRVSSYYAAASLPVYVRNVHRHHGLARLKGVPKFLKGGGVCYLEDPSHFRKAVQFFSRDAALSRQLGWPELRYILLNKDKKNFLLRRECMAARSHRLELNLLRVSHLLYEGEYLNLYELNTFSADSWQQ